MENYKKYLINHCKIYENLIFKNVYYQEDTKTIKKDDLFKNIKNLNSLYEKSRQNKKEEINIILETTVEEINRKKNSLPKWSITKNALLKESTFEMENLLRFEFNGVKEKYKSIYSGIDEIDMISDLLIWKIKEKKILEKCLDKKRKDELFNSIKEKVEELSNQYYIKEKEQKDKKLKWKNEIECNKKKLNVIKKNSLTIKNQGAKLEMEINNIFIQNEKLLRENSDRILAEKLEIEQLREELDKSNWKKYIGKTVQIRSILGNKNLDISGANINNFVPLILFDAHGQSNQKFTMILHGDNSVSFINNGFAIDVQYGIVKNCNQIQIYQRNDTDAQKFFIMYEQDGWFSLHSSLNRSYCIDINGGCPDNFTKIQLYIYNGSNAQKFKFIE